VVVYLRGAAGGVPVIEFVFDNEMDAYSVELFKPLDHPDGTTEDVLSFDVAVTGTKTGQPVNTSLIVKVEDDEPTSDTLVQNDVLVPTTSNVMIIMDTSNSMNNADGRGANAKLAAKNLLDLYEASGETRVRLVEFNTAAFARGTTWMTVAEAKAAIDVLTFSGATNYDGALAVAMTAYNDGGRLHDAPNYSYFVTDGQPSIGDGNTTTLLNEIAEPTADIGIQATETNIWRNFLTANSIKSQALAFSAGFDSTGIAQIAPIAYDGNTGTALSGVYVANPSNLSEVWTGLAETPIVGTLVGASGNDAVTGLLETVGYGGDGGYLYSVEVLGGVFTYNRLNDSVSKTGGASLTYTYNATTDELVVTDAAASKELTIDMLTGVYRFVAPVDTSTLVKVGLRDNDGDAGTVDLTLDVDPDASAAGVSTLSARVSEEGFAGAYADDGGGYRLYYGTDTTNASAAAGSFAGYVVDAITGPSGFLSAGSAVTWSSSTVGGVLTMTGTAAGNTVMTVQFNNNTGSYSVNLVRGLNHNINEPEGALDLKFVLSGTQAGDAIQNELVVTVEDDMTGGTMVLGWAGNDTLTGTASANLIVGGRGQDNLTGGAGADTFAWFLRDSLDTTPGNAYITDFKLGTYNIATTGAAAPDRLNLSSMLVGETGSNLQNYLNVSVAGGDTVIRVSANGGFSGGVYNAGALDMTIYLLGTAVPGTSNPQYLNNLLTSNQLVIG
jgi:hypothetical protein